MFEISLFAVLIVMAVGLAVIFSDEIKDKLAKVKAVLDKIGG